MQNPLPHLRPLPRQTILGLIHNAVQTGNTRFARQACLSWLAAYPGDLPITLLYAQILDLEGHSEQALPVLRRLVQTDPEYLEAVRLLYQAEQAAGVQAPTRKAPPRRRSIATGESLGWLQALETAGSSPKMAAATESATVAAWSEAVRQARQALGARSADLEPAEAALNSVLANEKASPLVGVTHLRVLKARDFSAPGLLSLADYYRGRWPECLQFQLLLAETLVQAGRDNEAVTLLHKAAARDLTGQVPQRLWGEEHPYRSLWPDRLELILDIPIPASVAAAMGWNQLPEMAAPVAPEEPASPTPAFPAGSIPDELRETPLEVNEPAAQEVEEPALEETRRVISKAAKERQDSDGKAPVSPLPGRPGQVEKPRPIFNAIPETLRSVQEELEKVAERLHQPELAKKDGRFPVYVVMTTRHGLKAQYGSRSADVDASLQRLVEAVRSRRDWRALLFYADEGLPPDVSAARPADPWALKLSLVDLDAYLGSKGEMIGAVLIVGGPEVVPFHHLPNPVDDADDDVASDNPYATRDENYFVPEWSVGRLPGGASRDPGELLALLDGLTTRHASLAGNGRPRRLSWIRRLLDWIASRLRARRSSLGYSAAIWRKASQMVFRPIGDAGELRVSPPLCASGAAALPLPWGRLAYFNLHGLEDAVEWYGQSESIEDGGGCNPGESPQDYPVALRPQDIINSGRAPEVVFSEACYGAHILGKTVEEAIALKFLRSGSQAVVGSTCTAYGSLNTPLTAADYLGHAFWNALNQGSSAGDALRRAKFSLAREMHHRQGYLDGEDQKTLISFVLYGDPLAKPLGPVRQAKGAFRPVVMRSLKPPRGVKTICDKATQEDLQQPVPQEVVDYVKGVVEQYLPGMEGAQVAISHEHMDCIMNGHECPTGQLRIKTGGKNLVTPAASQAASEGHDASRRIVILSKEVSGAAHVHRHYARLTLDEQNRLVKLVVSR